MEARVIESIELWFQEAGSEEAVNFIDFMLFLNESAYSLLHRDTLHGIFTYQVRYQDGTSQSVSFDKDEWVVHERNEWQTGMSGGEWVWWLVERWRFVVEWWSGRDFRTGDVIEESFYGTIPYGEIQHLDVLLYSIIENDALNTKALIKEGYYHDPLLHEWIAIPDSTDSLRSLVLTFCYNEGILKIPRTIERIEVTFTDLTTGAVQSLASALEAYEKPADLDLDDMMYRDDMFYRDESIQGTIRYEVTYQGGRVQYVEHDKLEIFMDWDMAMINWFFEHWKKLYEAYAEKSFPSGRPLQRFESGYDYWKARLSPEAWDELIHSTDPFDQQRLTDKRPRDEIQRAKEQFEMMFNQTAELYLENLRHGFYVDQLLEQRIDVESSFDAVIALYKEISEAERKRRAREQLLYGKKDEGNLN
ncbi:hypothetical protein A6395_04520 [Exiguobacterium sp. SH31]|uniref:hypothetical protein n=1 Tax=unclassified Exiguobacterium TaxID=2644629 RepID=UPI0008D6A624|nr:MULTISPECIES: hypothetical protein [unclassified Exiguobacterium]OGX79870.1 hypothetical protein A6395_04520 [Exiguobacterium sp. SH31]TCI73490.1 hypothetical protein EVJ22_03585 [Exiguobacterium sp. SH0S7]